MDGQLPLRRPFESQALAHGQSATCRELTFFCIGQSGLRGEPFASRFPEYRARRGIRHSLGLENALHTGQLADRFALGEDRHGAALVIGERLVVVDVEMAVDRGP